MTYTSLSLLLYTNRPFSAKNYKFFIRLALKKVQYYSKNQQNQAFQQFFAKDVISESILVVILSEAKNLFSYLILQPCNPRNPWLQ